MENKKINTDGVIADAESAAAIMHEQSKGYNKAAHEAELARIAAEETANPGVDSWRFFTDCAAPTGTENEYMDACIKAVDGPTGRRF